MTRPKSKRVATHRLEWRGIVCRVRHKPDYFGGRDLIEVFVVTPKAAIFPITETGYLAAFRESSEVAAAGSAVALFLGMINQEGATARWRALEVRRAQLDLFDDL